MKTSARKSYLAIAITLAITLASSVARGQQPKIVVGPNVQVSAGRANMNHGEVIIAADPKNPDWLIGCSDIFPDPLKRRLSDSVTYTSHDGGANWTPTQYIDAGGEGSGDPSCGFGSNGRAYTAFLAPAVKPDKDDVLFYRSTDGGMTWSEPTHLDWIDREYITVDNSGGKYDGHVYVNGTGSAMKMDSASAGLNGGAFNIGISVQRSLDGGASFHPPIKRFSTPPRYTLGMGNGVVLSDGTYIALYGEPVEYSRIMEKHPTTPNALLRVISSTDGGASFENAVTVSPWYMDYGEISGNSSVVPMIAVDKSSGPFRDHLYAAWPDFRSGRGEIMVSSSSDKGRTWSSPVVVNDDRAWATPARGPDDVMPMIDVNRNGVVGIAWYDRRDDPKNWERRVRFSASTDGGETFSPSVPVSEAPATININGTFPLNGYSLGGGKPDSRNSGGDLHLSVHFGDFFTFDGGDTAGMAADAGGRFHPLWVDNRTGVEQVWSAAITVDANAVRNGSDELKDMADVSNDVTLDFKNGSFDSATKTFSVDAYLGNTSDVTVKGPIRIRVLNLESRIGAVSIQNSDNGISGNGALWDFTSVVPNQSAGLAPGERTAPKKLMFHIDSPDWGNKAPSADDLQQFVMFRSKALAPKPIGAK